MFFFLFLLTLLTCFGAPVRRAFPDHLITRRRRRIAGKHWHTSNHTLTSGVPSLLKPAFLLRLPSRTYRALRAANGADALPSR